VAGMVVAIFLVFVYFMRKLSKHYTKKTGFFQLVKAFLDYKIVF